MSNALRSLALLTEGEHCGVCFQAEGECIVPGGAGRFGPHEYEPMPGPPPALVERALRAIATLRDSDALGDRWVKFCYQCGGIETIECSAQVTVNGALEVLAIDEAICTSCYEGDTSMESDAIDDDLANTLALRLAGAPDLLAAWEAQAQRLTWEAHYRP